MAFDPRGWLWIRRPVSGRWTLPTLPGTRQGDFMADKVNQRRIVVGVDGSQPSKQALRWAVRQAELIGAAVEAVHAWQVPVTGGWAETFDVVNNVTKAGEQMLADSLADVTGEHPRVTVEANVVEGHPALVLVQAADGAELLVLGCRGHGGFAGALLGSVSQYCVQHATCPVLVLRDPDQ
jgi:nucleotide-binding universal stress UspA family protein